MESVKGERNGVAHPVEARRMANGEEDAQHTPANVFGETERESGEGGMQNN